jgi:hypothetical protein
MIDATPRNEEDFGETGSQREEKKKMPPGVGASPWKGSIRTRESKEIQAFSFDSLWPGMAQFCWIWLDLDPAWI